ncbi:hypothetical protein [Actinomadura rupiterrae]|uniref:hypothetical protein n=1 Tax=Actinomadura rupiterrae TaxID=559627 RepID=UPI0020A47705|nr:hypothetical protein [Actinomadura rupiterrae]MCP2334921.1 hypothetical protein [Actinomadura rupiterrae]
MDDELGAALRDHFRRAADDIQPDAALLRRLRDTATASREPSPGRVLPFRRSGDGPPDGFGGLSGRDPGIARRRGLWTVAAVAAAVAIVALVFTVQPSAEKKTRPADRVVPASSPSTPGAASPLPSPPPGKLNPTPKPTRPSGPGKPHGGGDMPPSRPTGGPADSAGPQQPGGPSVGDRPPASTSSPHGIPPSSTAKP